MNVTNLTGLPETVFKALTRNEYTRGKSDRSVTQLIDGPRPQILRTEQADNITEDAADMVWSVLGTAVHKVFEGERVDGHIIEERLYAEVDNWVISGAIDLQRHEEDGTVGILDYKCTSVWSVLNGPKPEWEKQLNFYAWLVRECKGLDVTSLSIIVILRDWQRMRAEFDSSYPQAAIQSIDVPLWSVWDQDAYVKERVRVHQHASFARMTGGKLPECTDQERWHREGKIAVKKKGGKKALKLFTSMDEANAYLKEGQEIEVREGEYVRCAGNWCRVAEYCDQWRDADASD